MKTKLLVLMLLAAGSVFAGTHVFVGVGGGYGYYGAPPVVAYAPPCPGPGYYWVDGYWGWSGPHRFWHGGYWAAPRVYGGYGYGPRYYGGGYYGRGYYGGGRGHAYGHYGNGFRGHDGGGHRR